MQRITLKASHTLALIMAGMLLSAPAFADKPSGAGSDKGGKHGQKDQDDRHQKSDRDQRDQRGAGERRHFDDHQRTATREYYTEQFRAGRCPPGLAKKHNGCMPPGHAKKWQVGRPLPRDVIFYNLPPQVIIQLGQPPARHRYVRVATDILLIAVGTGMVVDAIEDLGGM